MSAFYKTENVAEHSFIHSLIQPAFMDTHVGPKLGNGASLMTKIDWCPQGI